MKVLLIFPRIEHGITSYKDKNSWRSILFGYPIITLPHLAAITPKKHRVNIINENYDNIDFTDDCDLVGITSYTMTAPRAYDIADEFHRHGIKVVLGGYHPSALPFEAIQHCDSVVQGWAEPVWSQLLDDVENDKMKQFYKSDDNFSLDDVPMLRRDLITHNPLLGAVQTTRGCPNFCEFCAVSSFSNHKVYQRSINQVIEEIKLMPNRIFIFHDPHLTLNPSYAKQLFKEMIKHNIKKIWVANATTAALMSLDEEFYNLARKAGCVEWFIGFESINQITLNNIKKKQNKTKDFHRLVKKLHNSGMTVQAGIIFGFDEDTPDIFDMTLDKLYEFEIDVLEVNILTPYPGTPLFRRLDDEGRILTKDWSKYNQVDVVFQPKNMTVDQLYQGTKNVAKKFYSWKQILNREVSILKTNHNIGVIFPLGNNITFRRYYFSEYENKN